MMIDVRFVHVALRSDARTESTRLMWWQPENSGLDMDQWAVDELLVSGYTDLRNVDDDFDGKPVTVDICDLSVVAKSYHINVAPPY